MKKLNYIIPFIALLFFTQFMSGCKKDILLSKGNLAFSVDTVLFDTLFTTVGSTTKRFLIYNEANQPVKISKVWLEGGTSSPYRVNLDGVSGIQFKDIMIPRKDSIFMFIEVTLGINNDTNPMIVEDRILFETNGVEQAVQLATWGQDAYFHYKDTTEGDWPNDKPHVIYNYSYVAPQTSVTIKEGTKIHLHKDAILYIDEAALNIEGTFENKVIIQGDRLEPFYKEVKGQYYGIYFNKALSSKIDNAVIINGTSGIHIYGDNPSNSDYTLRITHSEIANHSSYGIFNYAGGRVYGENLNVHNNGYYAFFLLEGGDYNFKHCQFISYGSDGSHPAVAIKNYLTHEDGYTYIADINEGKIYNSIITGGGSSQVAFDTLTNNGAVSIQYDYRNNLIKQETPIEDDTGFLNTLWNDDPKFESLEDKIYIITTDSPCKDAGEDFGVMDDIEGRSRFSDSAPDIGAYEIE